MVIQVHVEGIAKFEEVAKDYVGKKIFALFSGSVDENGKNWCPDCVTADPVVSSNVKHAAEDAVFIHCGVGNRDYWKDQKNDFRTNPKLKLKCVPTLMIVGKPNRLEEGQCANGELVKMLFEDE
ncbi:thioredoxin domain-containing protein 17-like [Mizuhopecten yessoensis]|uniref:Thioredoxin domain-containing protein 17 n=1 Tax=Mizuhopecten yessoensis TaxID=6573 RepID=A0A210PXC7_MIZYE|nr:thioredoxin domain-containing protein 17-like [Mizuhopecten yessoensis]OWF41141.1 Thioredoxin domain-containing protein 17 [Mizuhopecten yessoensis]